MTGFLVGLLQLSDDFVQLIRIRLSKEGDGGEKMFTSLLFLCDGDEWDAMQYLRPGVKLEDSYANILQVMFDAAEEEVPRGFLGEDDAQLTSAQVDAGTGDCLWAVAHEDVRPQRVIHIVPTRKQKERRTFFSGGRHHQRARHRSHLHSNT